MSTNVEKRRSVLANGMRLIAVLEIVGAAAIVLFAYRIPVLKANMAGPFLFANCYVLLSLLTRVTWQQVLPDLQRLSWLTAIVSLMGSSMSLIFPLVAVWRIGSFLTWMFGGGYPSDPSILGGVLGWYSGTVLACGLSLSLSVLAWFWRIHLLGMPATDDRETRS